MLVPVGGLLGCVAGVGDSVKHIKSPGEGLQQTKGPLLLPSAGPGS